jgi:hypothetical protein
LHDLQYDHNHSYYSLRLGIIVVLDSILRVVTGAAVLQGMMVQRQIVPPAFHRRCHVHVVVMIQVGMRREGEKEACFVSHI